jgi:hypothetical protein
MPQAEAPMGSPHFRCHAWMYVCCQALLFLTEHSLCHLQLDEVCFIVYRLHMPTLIPSLSTGLDEDTQRQLNRIEAMLSGICASKGIIPETLPGYECRRSASPSSLSPSSPGMHMEMLNISDTCIQTHRPTPVLHRNRHKRQVRVNTCLSHLPIV